MFIIMLRKYVFICGVGNYCNWMLNINNTTAKSLFIFYKIMFQLTTFKLTCVQFTDLSERRNLQLCFSFSIKLKISIDYFEAVFLICSEDIILCYKCHIYMTIVLQCKFN